MTTIPELPSDGPEGPLTRLARTLGLRYSDTFIATTVARHPKPTSLLALVEVARSLGMKVTAGRADIDALDDIDLPAVVHLVGGGGEEGFGVLESVAPEGYEVWDSVHGSQTIARDDFAHHWTGILGPVQRDASTATTEPRYRTRRALEILTMSTEPPSLVGGRGAVPLRVVLTLVLITLAAVAVTEMPSGHEIPVAVIAILTSIGLAASIVAAMSSGRPSAFAEQLCRRGKVVDCKSVLNSRYSRIFGFSLSDVGIAFFGSILLALASSIGDRHATVGTTIAVAYLGTIPFSVALIGVQISTKQLCSLCLTIHVVNIASAVTAWTALEHTGTGYGLVLPSILLLGLYFGLLLFLVIPYFHKSEGLSWLSGLYRRMSSSPFASLAQLLTAPATDVRGRDCGVAITNASAPHEIVAFVNPSCHRCTPMLRDVASLAGDGLVEAYVTIPPKDPDDAQRHAASAILAVGLASGGADLLGAYSVAKRNVEMFVSGDPVESLSDALEIPNGAIAAHLDDALRLVERAEALGDAHTEGTPAVFVDGRAYRGPISHLRYLLTEHPALLASVGLRDHAAVGEPG